MAYKMTRRVAAAMSIFFVILLRDVFQLFALVQPSRSKLSSILPARFFRLIYASLLKHLGHLMLSFLSHKSSLLLPESLKR
jgi:hypothetical protein